MESPSKRSGRGDLTTASLRRIVKILARLPPLRYHRLGVNLDLHIRLRPQNRNVRLMRNGIGLYQIVGGYFGNNICVHSIAVLFVQEISVSENENSRSKWQNNNQFARADHTLAGYFMESIIA